MLIWQNSMRTVGTRSHAWCNSVRKHHASQSFCCVCAEKWTVASIWRIYFETLLSLELRGFTHVICSPDPRACLRTCDMHTPFPRLWFLLLSEIRVALHLNTRQLSIQNKLCLCLFGKQNCWGNCNKKRRKLNNPRCVNQYPEQRPPNW